MWELALPALALLFFVPFTRQALAWVLTLIIVPVTLWRRTRYEQHVEYRKVEVNDPSLPVPSRSVLARQTAEFVRLGWEPRGAWRIDRVDGASSMFVAIFFDAARTRCAEVIVSLYNGIVAQAGVSISATTPQRRVGCTTTRQAPIENETAHIYSFPRLVKLEWLLEAQQALESRYLVPGEPPAKLPENDVQLLEWLSASRTQALQTLQKNGQIRPARGGAYLRPTFKGVFAGTKGALRPWSTRAMLGVLATEERVLRDLGLAHLFDRACRQQPERPVTSDVLQIRDDRGEPRTVAKEDSTAGDDRNADPRFRSILRLSAQTRQGVISPNTTRNLLVMLTAMLVVSVVSGFLGIPLYYGVILVIGSTILLTTMGSGKRVAAAEDAAAAVILRHGLCPSCLYSLAGLEEAPDHCVVCPECGGAWLRRRVSRFASFSVPHREDSAQTAVRGAVDRVTRTFVTAGTSIRDDHGEHRALVSARLRTELDAADPAHHERLLAARRDLARIGRVARWGAALFIAAFMVGLPLFMIFRHVSRGGWSLALPLLLSPAFGALLVYGILRGSFGYTPRRVVLAMRNHDLCPACAQWTAPLKPQEEGCVVCECGAAWRVLPPRAADPPALESLSEPAPS